MAGSERSNVLKPGTVRLRRFCRAVAGRLLPARVFDEHGMLTEAERWLSRGGGLVVLLNHFSRRDAVQVLVLVCRSGIICSRPFVAPVALHQLTPPVRFLTDHLQLGLHPVVSRHTDNRAGPLPDRRATLNAYLQAAVRCLSQGGVVLLAPQAGRRSTLGPPLGRPVGNLLSAACAANVTQVALLPLGLSLPGVSDYGSPQVRGLCQFRRFDVRVGRLVTVEDAAARANGLLFVDLLVFELLRELVPPAYGGNCPEAE